MTGQAPKLQSREERLKNLLFARADRMMQDVTHTDGSLARKGMSKEKALEDAMVSFQRLPAQSPERAQLLADYLDGKTEEVPEGWLPELPKNPPSAFDPEVAREHAPWSSAHYDYISGPVSKFYGMLGQGIYDIGRGLAHAQRDYLLPMAGPAAGALSKAIPDIPARDVRTDVLAAARSLVEGDLKSAASIVWLNEDPSGIRKETADALSGMDESAGIASQVLQGVGETTGHLRSFGATGPKQVLQGGAMGARELAARFGAKLRPGSIGDIIVGGSGSFGLYEGLSATGEDGSAPTHGERLKGLGYGIAIGPAIELTNVAAQRVFSDILKRGIEGKGFAESGTLEAIQKWAIKNNQLRVRNESLEAYAKRTSRLFLENGAPGVKMPWAKVRAHLARAGIEALAFSLLGVDTQEELVAAVWDMKQGLWEANPAKMEESLEHVANVAATMAETFVGLALLHVPYKDVLRWQRNVPTISTSDYTQPRLTEPKPDQPPEPTRMDAAKAKAKEAATTRPTFTDSMRMGWRMKPQTKAVDASDPAAVYKGSYGVEKAPEGIGEPKKGKRGKKLPADYKSPPVGAQIFDLPGTNYSFEVLGDMAIPSPSLRKALGLPSSTVQPNYPRQEFERMLVRAELISTLQGDALLPGEPFAVGMKRDGQRLLTLRLGEVLESPLSATPKWKPVEGDLKVREPDKLGRDQQQIVEGLRAVLNGKQDLPQADRVMLSNIIDKMSTVSGAKDETVAEAIATIPMLSDVMSYGHPEQVGEAIQALAEILTIKSSEVAIADLAARERQQIEQQELTQQAIELGYESAKSDKSVDRPGEAGFVDPGVLADAAIEFGKVAGKTAMEVADATFVGQIRSIEKRLGSADKGLTQGMRLAASRRRTTEGEAYATIETGMKEIKRDIKRLMETVDVNGLPKARWDALLHREIKPEPGTGDAAVAKALNDTLLGLWRASRESGTVLQKTVGQGKDKKTVFFRPTEKDIAKMPRTWGRDYEEVMSDPPLRQAWFRELESRNPGEFDAAKAEAEHVERVGQAATRKITDAERESSIENIRYVENVPYVWNGKKMLEENVLDAFNRVIQDQAARLSVISVFGQEGVPAAELAKLGLDPTKTGAPDRVGRAIKRVSEAKKITSRDLKVLTKDINDVIVQLQGRDPKDPSRLEGWIQLSKIPKSVLTITAGIYDVPSTFFEGLVFGGFIRTAKAINYVLRNYGDAETAARKAGTLVDRIMHLDAEDGTTLINRLTDLLSKPGNFTEKLKVKVFDQIVDYVMQDFAEGRGTNADKLVLQSLRFTPQQITALMNGTASKDLRQMLRHEMVQDMTSRGHSAERSKFGASRLLNSMIWFGQFAVKRTEKLARESVQFFKVVGNKRSTVGERMAAMKRMTYRLSDLAIGGAIASLLYYMWNDMFRGEVGAVRWVNDMANYPGQMMKKAILGQAFTGPLGTVVQAADDDTDALARVVAPLNLLTKGIDAVHRLGTGADVHQVAWDTLTSFGAIPQGRQLKELVGLGVTYALAGNTERLSDVNSYRDWKRLEGIPWKEGFQRNKTNEYYAVMRSIKKIINNEPVGNMTDEQAANIVLPKIETELRQVLNLQPEDTVAGSIRAMKLVDTDLTDEQRDRLLQYWGEPRYARVMAHDQMIDELARTIGRDLKGTDPTPFSDALDMAARQALGNAKNPWKGVVDRAVDDAADAILEKRELGGDLRAVARRMAQHPETLPNDSTFSEDDLRVLRPTRAIPMLESIIYRKLYTRASNSASAKRTRERKERLKKGQ